MEKAMPSKSNEQYVEFLRTELSLRYFDQKYRNAYKWLPYLPLLAPDVSSSEALKTIRDRVTQLRAKRQQFRKAQLKAKANRPHLQSGMVQSMVVKPILTGRRYFQLLQDRTGIDKEMISWEAFLASKGIEFVGIPGITPFDPTRKHKIDGTVQASGFREYIWAHPEKNDTYESHLFLPYGEFSVDPYNYTGATGLQFLGEIEVQPSLLLDSPDYVGFGGVLQYTLPEAKWDGTVWWNIRQHIDIPEVTSNADFGFFSIASVARQEPNGEDFPDNFVDGFSLNQMMPVISTKGDNYSLGPFSADDTFFSGFSVSKGQVPRIYVGISIYLMATDGTLSLGDPNMAYQLPATGEGKGLSYSYVES